MPDQITQNQSVAALREITIKIVDLAGNPKSGITHLTATIISGKAGANLVSSSATLTEITGGAITDGLYALRFPLSECDTSGDLRIEITQTGVIQPVTGYIPIIPAVTATVDNAAVAAAVWDQARSGHQTSGSFGEFLDAQASVILAAAPSAAPSAATVAAAVWQLTRSGHQPTGSFGEILDARISAVTGTVIATSSAVATVPFSMTKGDLEPDMPVTFTELDGTATNLSSATLIQLRWTKPDGTVSTVALTAVDLVTGQMKRVWVAGDTTQIGRHRAQGIVTDTNGELTTYPRNGSQYEWFIFASL